MSILDNIKVACCQISNLLTSGNCLQLGSKISVNNSCGDEVKKLDVLSNDIMKEALLNHPDIRAIGSEEDEDIIYTENKDGKYFVSFDPLDGSSNIKFNISVGTIFCVFEYIDGQIESGRNIVMAGYAIYGFNTLLVTTTDNGLDIYLLNNNRFEKISEGYRMPITGNIYAINESNKYRWLDNRIQKYVDLLINEKKTVRWIGCMVTDVHRTLIKGGLFAYPLDSKSPKGRLRLIYEAYPMAYIFQCAGGYSSNENKNILDIKFPEDIHSRTSVMLFSKKEYEQFCTF